MPFDENARSPFEPDAPDSRRESVKNLRDSREPLRKLTFSKGLRNFLDRDPSGGHDRSQVGEVPTAVRATEIAKQEYGPLEPFWLSVETRYAHNYTVFIRGLLDGLCDHISTTTQIPRPFLRLKDFRTEATSRFIIEYVSPKWRRYNFGGIAKRLLRFIYTYDSGEPGLLDPRLAESLSLLYESLYHRNPGTTRDLGCDDPEPVRIYRTHLDDRGVRRGSNDVPTIREFIRWWVACKDGREFCVSEVSTSDIWAFRAYLLGKNTEDPKAPKRKPGTTSAMLNCIKRWFGFLTTRGMISADPSEQVAPIPSEAHERPRYLDAEACIRFLKALVRHATEPCLEMALFLVLMSTGMRPAEGVSLEVGSISLREGTVTFRRKKSGRLATLPLHPLAVYFLEIWLHAHPRSHEANAPLWLYKGQAMSINMVQARFKTYRDVAGIPAHVGGAHVFRHTLASHLVKETSLEVLQQVFGHLNPWTLSFYLHVMAGLDKLMVAWGHYIVDGGEQDDR